MEIAVRLGKVTARDIERELPDAPTYSAVRSILRILVKKGLLVKDPTEERDWYTSAEPVAKAKTGAMQALVSRFFANSVTDAACALLGGRNVKLTAEEANRLIKLIEEAKRK